MNDRYLYRAKRKNNGEWVEGAYYIEPYTDKCFIIQWNSTGLGFNEFIEVDGATVCQCTGLNDKNGKLIWENDIVEIENVGGTSYKYLIWWNREMNLMDSVPLDGIAFNGHDYWNGHYPNFHYETFCTMMQDPWGDFSDIKVISNIFDNQELLEVQ